MAFDFTAALKNIATAVYGRDMRKALHDTIEDLDSRVNAHKKASVIDHPDRSVTHDKLAISAVEHKNLADNSVYGDVIKNGAIDSAKINSGAVGETEIAHNAVQNKHIAAGAVYGDVIKDGAVTREKLGTGAVAEENISWNAVQSKHIADNAISQSKLANDSVAQSKIIDGAVTEHKIANGAVTTKKIANGNVTTDKIQNGAVTFDKLGTDVKNGLKPYTLVAASNSTDDIKAIADYVCTGSSDETVINQAIKATPDGGEVVLARGWYRMNTTNTNHILVNKRITLRGETSPSGGSVVMTYGAGLQCTYGTAICIAVEGCTIRDLTIDGNTDYGYDGDAAGITVDIPEGDWANNHFSQRVMIENVLIRAKYYGILINSGENITVTHCSLDETQTSIWMSGDAKGCTITENRINPWNATSTPIIANSGQNNILNNDGCDSKSTITVAAYDSSSTDKVNVDFVCDGRTDHTTISHAIAALPKTGGRVILMPGTYLIGGSINTNVSKSVWIQGCGYGTKLCGAANAYTFFASRNVTRAEGTELRVSDLTICNNSTKMQRLVEGSGYQKSADFENVTFRSDYTIPSGRGYTAATYTYGGNIGNIWTAYGSDAYYEDNITYVNCRLVTDYAFTYGLQDVIMKNFCVIGSKSGVTQTFNVYDSDVDIRAPRGGLVINAKGNARVAKTDGVTVNLSGTGNTAY